MTPGEIREEPRLALSRCGESAIYPGVSQAVFAACKKIISCMGSLTFARFSARTTFSFSAGGKDLTCLAIARELGAWRIRNASSESSLFLVYMGAGVPRHYAGAVVMV